MRYTRNSLSVVVMVVAGFLVLGTGQVSAQVIACFVTIEKEASPADNTGFLFDRSDDGQFLLRDPGDPTEEFTVFDGTPVTVTEQVPEGWALDGTQCSAQGVDILDVEDGVTFSCLTIDGNASCTFSNVIENRIIPTLSNWGLVAIAGILGMVGFLVIRRRKITG